MVIGVMALVDQIYARPFVWGQSDCCTRACDVIRARGYADPMAPLRGQYRGPVGAARLIRQYGGWQQMCAALADRVGFVPGGKRPGAALGLVAQGDLGCVLAVAVPDGWAVPVDCGVVIVPQVVASWGHHA